LIAFESLALAYPVANNREKLYHCSGSDILAKISRYLAAHLAPCSFAVLTRLQSHIQRVELPPSTVTVLSYCEKISFRPRPLWPRVRSLRSRVSCGRGGFVRVVGTALRAFGFSLALFVVVAVVVIVGVGVVLARWITWGSAAFLAEL